MEERSGLLKAGEILLLVQAILSWVSGGLLFIAALIIMAAASRPGMLEAGGASIGVVYILIALLVVVGGFLSYKGYGKTKEGDLNGGFKFGLAGALVPPVQAVGLIGAIFVKVCPEAETQTVR